MASKYVIGERRLQAQWREHGHELPEPARRMGTFDGNAYPWLLATEFAEFNLWAPIRVGVLDHFARHNIAWHDEEEDRYGHRSGPGPSPNLMDSQVACLNFWWGLAAVSPEALLAVVQVFAPTAVRMVSPTSNGALVEPEWMGLRNYLGELGMRRRGQYATSADLLLAWVDGDGLRHGALLESKYSESYKPRDLRYSRSGRDRLAIYSPAAAQPWSPFSGSVPLEALMFDPFDQHLRQQLLAAAIAEARELELATVRLVHVAPAANGDFHDAVTAPVLRRPGRTVAEAWLTVLKRPQDYTSLSYEELFQTAIREVAASNWADALRARYGWAQ